VELNRVVECPNGCVSCDYCGGLLADQEMIDNGDVEAVEGMHVDCAGEYRIIQKAEMQGDREWAEQEMYESQFEQEFDPEAEAEAQFNQ